MNNMGAEGVYIKRLDEEIEKISSAIRDMSKDLRCCGNCINLGKGNICKNILNKYYFGGEIDPYVVCVDWSYDGLVAHEREVTNND